MKKDLDEWSLLAEEEDAKCNLYRLLIAFDELRARLAPSKYPNIEISDEGHLWFNIETSIGTVEAIALPFGFKLIEHPSILVSLPRKAEDVNLDFLNKIREIPNSTDRFQLFGGFSTNQEILDAYKQNKHPSLVCTQDFDEILEMKRQSVFFTYLGICFSVIGKTVSEIEQTIRDIVLKLEGKVGVLPK